MQLNITGGTKRQKEILGAAAEFFAGSLLHGKTVNSLILDIEITKGLDVKGECVNEDDNKRSRWFTINLCQDDEHEMVRTLAHEMVHVKQHVKNELGTCHMALTRGGLKIERIWQGEVWKPGKNEDAYFDSPWEIEAYGKEVGLTYRFMKHWNGE